MPGFTPTLLNDVRARFAHVDSCPFQGPRIFFENAGGALTLNSVIETSAKFAALPDNQGRDNPAAHALMEVIARSKSDMKTFFNASSGQFFVGESGTELIFRVVRTATMGSPAGSIIGATVEHPATRSAATHWAEMSGKSYVSVAHDPATGTVAPEAYAAQMRPDIRVATVLHTSPVTGMVNDVAGIAAAIRESAPDALIIVDGIQHASHGHIDIDSYDIDAYIVSPYKVFSRHGYGVAWVSDRITAMPLEQLQDGPRKNWEFGTRDTGAYATFSDVVAYFLWLGGQTGCDGSDRSKIEAAAQAIHAHETMLTDIMINGTGNLAGLADLPGVTIIGGAQNSAREGLVCFALDHLPAADVVSRLNAQRIRTHIRKADHYSGNILNPLGLDSAVRVSLCHYNTEHEIKALLAAMKEIATGE